MPRTLPFPIVTDPRLSNFMF